MPIETKRRVGVVGKSRTFYVTLPLHWCQGSGIEQGSEVGVLAGRVLVVIPPQAKEDAEPIRKLMLQRGFL
jgi:hypothetical protein